MHRLRFFGTLGATCILASSVYAVDAGTYDAYLESIDGDRIKLAQIQSHDDGRYSLTLDEESFSDHFLSMRPFKCLEGPNKHWCHVPYPTRSIAGYLLTISPIWNMIFCSSGKAQQSTGSICGMASITV